MFSPSPQQKSQASLDTWPESRFPFAIQVSAAQRMDGKRNGRLFALEPDANRFPISYCRQVRHSNLAGTRSIIALFTRHHIDAGCGKRFTRNAKFLEKSRETGAKLAISRAAYRFYLEGNSRAASLQIQAVELIEQMKMSH